MFLTGDNWRQRDLREYLLCASIQLTDDIADSKDVRGVGTQLFVALDETTVVNFHACFACVEVFTVRHDQSLPARRRNAAVQRALFAFHRH